MELEYNVLTRSVDFTFGVREYELKRNGFFLLRSYGYILLTFLMDA